jgi:hypothetical protein
LENLSSVLGASVAGKAIGVTLVSPPAGPTTADQSAKGQLDAFLGNYGLQSLGDTVWSWYLQGQSTDQIMLNVRSTPEYQARFPAMDTLAKRGQAITESQYVNYEQAIGQQNQAAGLPQGMYDTPDDIKNLLVNNISPAEYQSRVQAYQTAAWQSPPEVRQALMDDYGLTPGQLTAFFIDPDRALPLIQRDLATAQMQGASQTSGFGQISAEQGGMLSDLGVSQAQAQAGFSKLGNENQLIQGLPGQQPGIGTDTALQAQFAQNTQAQQQLEAAAQDQLNLFKQGGGPGATSKGALGAGSTT